MDKNIRLSYIVCTYNGSKRLPDTLTALVLACQGFAECEILLIDNASTDNTFQVAKSILENSGVGARVLSEPKPGKANALKLGFCEARGDLFSIVDDDNHVDSMWGRTVVEFMDARPDVGLIGPRIIGTFPDGPAPDEYYRKPDWPSMLGILDLGQNCIEDKLPFGAGMTGRTKVMRWLYEHVGTYLSDRVGKKLSSCEDLEKAHLFKLLGWGAIYQPALTMKHVIPSSRLTQDYIDRVMFAAMRASRWLDVLREGEISRVRLMVGIGVDLAHVFRHILLPSLGLHKSQLQRQSNYWRQFFLARALGGVELIRRFSEVQSILHRLTDAPADLRRPTMNDAPLCRPAR